MESCNFELRKLSPDDGRDVYEMLRQIPENENGFINTMNGSSFKEFKEWLITSDEHSNGIGLESWMVPQTNYWLYVDGIPVGFGKLRHSLTEALRKESGHIGYSVKPGERGKGYGKLLLKLLLHEARPLKIDKVLITIHHENTPSIKTALANGGEIEKIENHKQYIWITC